MLAVIVLAMAGCGSAPGGPPAHASGSLTAGTGSGSPGPVVTVPASGTVSAVVVSPSPTVPARPRLIVAGRSGTVRLTQADAGATVVLRPGQRVVVVLGGPGPGAWDRPRATGSGSVLRLVSATGGYPASGPATATFLAVRPGRAAVTSMSDLACLHAVPACEIAQVQWRVAVVVKAH